MFWSGLLGILEVIGNNSRLTVRDVPEHFAFRIQASSQVPSAEQAAECRSSWIVAVQNHMTEMLENWKRVSSFHPQDRPMSLTKGSTYKPLSLIQYKTVTVSQTVLQDYPRDCDGHQHITGPLDQAISTWKTVVTSWTTELWEPVISFSTSTEATTGTPIFSLRYPQTDLLPSCVIASSECNEQWHLFKEAFKDSPLNHEKIVDLHPNYYTDTPEVKVKHSNASAIIETFLDWFKYTLDPGFFSGCAEARLSYLESCSIMPRPWMGNEQDGYFSGGVSPRTGLTSTSPSALLKLIQEDLGCDIRLNNFVLIAFPLSDVDEGEQSQHGNETIHSRKFSNQAAFVPRLWANTTRNICANDGWGELPSTLSSQYSISTRVLTKIPLACGKDIYFPDEFDLDMLPLTAIPHCTETTLTGKWTLTSPSVYLAYNNLAVTYPCNWRKPSVVGHGVLTIPPQQLSSIVPSISCSVQTQRSGVTTSICAWQHSTRQFNIGDLKGPRPWRVYYASSFISAHDLERWRRNRLTGIVTMTGNSFKASNTVWEDKFSPMLAIPSALQTLHPDLKLCRPFSWNTRYWSGSVPDFPGIWDPPLVNAASAGTIERPMFPSEIIATSSSAIYSLDNLQSNTPATPAQLITGIASETVSLYASSTGQSIQHDTDKGGLVWESRDSVRSKGGTPSLEQNLNIVLIVQSEDADFHVDEMNEPSKGSTLVQQTWVIKPINVDHTSKLVINGATIPDHTTMIMTDGHQVFYDGDRKIVIDGTNTVSLQPTMSPLLLRETRASTTTVTKTLEGSLTSQDIPLNTAHTKSEANSKGIQSRNFVFGLSTMIGFVLSMI